MLTAMIVGVFNESYLWMKSAKELGYTIIATHPIDIKDKYYYQDTKDYIDYFYTVSYDDKFKLLEIAKKHEINLVICHPSSNDATMTSAYINTELGLKGVDINSANIACNKLEFYKFLEKNQLPCPSFTFRLDNIDLNTIKFPCVVKPAFGAGSVGVKVIQSLSELKKFIQTKKYDYGYSLSKSHDDFYIVQDYVIGQKIMGCHSVVHEGKLKIFGRTYRYLNQEHNKLPYCYGQEFITTYDEITPKTSNAIEHLIKKLGVNNTPFDLEILLDENNDIISFIELNLRPAEKAFNHISGRNGYEYCIKEQVKLGTDLNCDFSEIGENKTYIGVKYFAFHPGIIKKIQWPETPSTCVFFKTKLQENSVITDLWNVNIAVENGSMILIDSSDKQIKQTFNDFYKNIIVEYQ